MDTKQANKVRLVKSGWYWRVDQSGWITVAYIGCDPHMGTKRKKVFFLDRNLEREWNWLDEDPGVNWCGPINPIPTPDALRECLKKCVKELEYTCELLNDLYDGTGWIGRYDVMNAMQQARAALGRQGRGE